MKSIMVLLMILVSMPLYMKGDALSDLRTGCAKGITSASSIIAGILIGSRFINKYIYKDKEIEVTKPATMLEAVMGIVAFSGLLVALSIDQRAPYFNIYIKNFGKEFVFNASQIVSAMATAVVFYKFGLVKEVKKVEL